MIYQSDFPSRVIMVQDVPPWGATMTHEFLIVSDHREEQSGEASEPVTSKGDPSAVPSGGLSEGHCVLSVSTGKGYT